MMKVKVDRALCQSHGVCAMEAAEVFGLGPKNELVIKQENPSEAFRKKVEAAIKFCPTRALSLEEQ